MSRRLLHGTAACLARRTSQSGRARIADEILDSVFLKDPLALSDSPGSLRPQTNRGRRNPARSRLSSAFQTHSSLGSEAKTGNSLRSRPEASNSLRSNQDSGNSVRFNQDSAMLGQEAKRAAKVKEAAKASVRESAPPREKIWAQDLEAYDVDGEKANAVEEDLTWFEGVVENLPGEHQNERAQEFVPRWKKVAGSPTVVTDKAFNPESLAAKSAALSKRAAHTGMDFSAEALRDGLVNVLQAELAADISVLDVSRKTDMTQYMIITVGRNKRQIYALVHAAKRFARNFVSLGNFMQPDSLSIEGEDSEDWMLLDAGTVIVHCFTPEGRETYELEKLWNNIEDFEREIESEEADNPALVTQAGGEPSWQSFGQARL